MPPLQANGVLPTPPRDALHALARRAPQPNKQKSPPNGELVSRLPHNTSRVQGATASRGYSSTKCHALCRKKRLGGTVPPFALQTGVLPTPPRDALHASARRAPQPTKKARRMASKMKWGCRVVRLCRKYPACRRLASGRRSARDNRTPFARKRTKRAS